MRLTSRPGLSSAWWRACPALALVLAIGPLTACDPEDLLKASRPSVVEATRLDDPSQAQLLLNGVIADFECAHGAFVAAGAIIGDELEDAQLAAAVWDYDRRSFNSNPGGQYGFGFCNAQLFGVYRPLATARWAADDLIRKLDGWTDAQVPDRTAKIATAAVYAGFSLAEMAMVMCSAAIDVGPEITPALMFQAAEERFTRAIQAATTASRADLLNAALAGRARVRLYQGGSKVADAAADAQLVPPGFVFAATAANDPNGRRWNRINHFVNFSRFHMVAAESRNLTTGGVADPRTASVTTTSRALDGRISVQQTKYTDLTSPMPITRYEEAQLILAEAQGGATAINVINALRARHNLPAMSTAEMADIQGTLIEERRRELWLEGQRFYDINRFQSRIPLTPAPGTEFAKGGAYGPTRCLPLPDVERFNNPCISQGICG
jgi:starch-binding outer membrane protein, SusD/RagB family